MILLNSSIQPSLKSYCSKHPYHVSCENNFSKSPTYSSQFTFNSLAILQIVVSKPFVNRSNKGYTPTSRQIEQKPPPSSGMGGTRVVSDKIPSHETREIPDIPRRLNEGQFLTASSLRKVGEGFFPFVNNSPSILQEKTIFIPPTLMDNSNLVPREDILSISALHINNTRDTNNSSPALDSRRIPEPTSGLGTFALVILSGYFLCKRKKNSNESVS